MPDHETTPHTPPHAPTDDANANGTQPHTGAQSTDTRPTEGFALHVDPTAVYAELNRLHTRTRQTHQLLLLTTGLVIVALVMLRTLEDS